MKTAQEVYTEYKIMPSLQLHQLRVAAVGKLLCDKATKPINARDVILECLFHDMGNIIKSDLQYFSDFVEPEGIEYWQNVKNGFVEKYGTDHHAANAAIAQEIGLPENARNILTGIGFSKLEEILLDVSNERKVCEYADLRVGPRGILSLQERLQEGRERYLRTRNSRGYYNSDDKFKELVLTAEALQEQVISLTSLTADDITDSSIGGNMEELRHYPVA